MNMVDIREAKIHLSRLIDRAVSGEPFIIAKAGRPLVKVLPYEAPGTPKRLGFMRGQGRVGIEVKKVGKKKVVALFER